MIQRLSRAYYQFNVNYKIRKIVKDNVCIYFVEHNHTQPFISYSYHSFSEILLLFFSLFCRVCQLTRTHLKSNKNSLLSAANYCCPSKHPNHIPKINSYRFQHKYSMVFPGFKYLLNKVPGGNNAKVFTGVVFLLGLSAVPNYIERNVKPGHELFSTEKPQGIEEHQQRMIEQVRRKQ